MYYLDPEKSHRIYCTDFDIKRSLKSNDHSPKNGGKPVSDNGEKPVFDNVGKPVS
jgi:hypothetical protein